MPIDIPLGMPNTFITRCKSPQRPVAEVTARQTDKPPLNDVALFGDVEQDGRQVRELYRAGRWESGRGD